MSDECIVQIERSASDGKIPFWSSQTRVPLWSFLNIDIYGIYTARVKLYCRVYNTYMVE